MNRDSTFKVLTLNTKDSNGKEPPQQDIICVNVLELIFKNLL